MRTSRATAFGAGEALAALVTIGAAALLIFIRGDVDSAVVALILAAVVSLFGALGGWRSGLAAAIAAAMSFNFFHAKPYLSLQIHDADDALTTLTLLVVGTIGGVAGSVSSWRRDRAVASQDELTAVERIADLVAIGDDAADVETAVRAELLSLLNLADCAVVMSLPEGMVTLGRGGALSSGVRVYHDGGFELPPAGVGIPILRRGETAGYLRCTPAPGVAISVARRRTAVTLADLLGMAYGRPSLAHHHN